MIGDLLAAGGLGGILSAIPEISLPELPEGLRPPRGPRGGRFRVAYLDDNMRITKGDRGEVRVFVRT